MQRESYPPSSGAVLLVPWQDLLASIFQILSTCPSAIAGTFNDYLFYLQTFSSIFVCICKKFTYTTEIWKSDYNLKSSSSTLFEESPLCWSPLCTPGSPAHELGTLTLPSHHKNTKIRKYHVRPYMGSGDPDSGSQPYMASFTHGIISWTQRINLDAGAISSGWGAQKSQEHAPLSWAAIAKKQQVCIQETRACFLQSVKNSEADPYERAPCMIRLSVALMGCF